jgi:quercetin dioxygenase-like cupin family protein
LGYGRQEAYMSFGEAEHHALPRPVLLGPGEGQHISMGQTTDYFVLKAGGEDTTGHVALLEYHAQPGSPGVPLHEHDGHDEGFYVVSGQLEVQLGDEVGLFGPGSFAYVPRGVAHRFGNPTDEPCLFLATFSPAGFERFFLERLRVVEEYGEGSDEVIALARQHGVTYLEHARQASRNL